VAIRDNVAASDTLSQDDGRRLVLSIVTIAIARCLLVLLFLPFSARDKALNFGAAVDQAAQAVRPRQLAGLLIIGGFCIEVLMSLAIVSGIFDRLAALVLALYCVVTALLWKQFWRQPDFRLRGESHGRELFWDFWKNLALAGGFLVLALGASTGAARDFWRHPLSSTHPYALRAGQIPGQGHS
jgi:putative oxidoreductase